MRRRFEGVERLKDRAAARQSKVRVVTRQWKGPEAMLLWGLDTTYYRIPRIPLL